MNSRQQTILQLVNDRRRISVGELARASGVSEVTIRQDLNLLEKRSYLKRVHGSAVALESDDVDARMMSNFTLKQKLAQYAASLVNDGETIFIESGSANALLARYLAERKRVTLITVSHYIAHLLKETDCDVIVLGGMYQKKSETVVGPLTRMCIQQVALQQGVYRGGWLSRGNWLHRPRYDACRRGQCGVSQRRREHSADRLVKIWSDPT
ncbi:Glycerol-3-phosphate regulon repressor [Serratia fonticola]|uniref:Glycerol-3-phosphate regulon repressor n=1 Tax=Serratia fonticola TaxID=47917 RepID=A0A4U9WJK3_SERFO|nr:Glycerol-3-phosphate regulon repressor [Serratia fonticola]